jgi:acyl-CoA reductase-like NAD-dependent aldehyde dehydrogenase
VSYVYTRYLNRALRVSEALQTGMVGLNQGLVSNPQAPFGGMNSQASDAKADTKASKSTWRTST